MRLGFLNISLNDRPRLLEVLQIHGINWLVLGYQALVWCSEPMWGDAERLIKDANGTLSLCLSDVSADDLYIVGQEGRLFQLRHPKVKVVTDTGRYLVVVLPPADRESVKENRAEFDLRRIEPFEIIFEVRGRPAVREARETWIQQIVDSVDLSQYSTFLSDLIAYLTRYSTSDYYSDAALWCQQMLDDYGYSTSTQVVSLGIGSTTNVIADKSGVGSGNRELLLLVAHLDSINSTGGPDAPAPGADDNASGAAGLLEIARVLKNLNTINDLRMVLFGGEEQSLSGSEYYVSMLSEEDKGRINAVINMDMIGCLNTTTPTVLLEGSSISQSVIGELTDFAGNYTELLVNTSLYPFASDHVPFIDAGLPAVLTIEGNDGANNYIHTSQDTLNHLDVQLAIEITRMNAAFIASKLEQSIGGVMSNDQIPAFEVSDLLADELVVAVRRLQWSGRYTYTSNGLLPSAATIYKEASLSRNPMYNQIEPVLLTGNFGNVKLWNQFEIVLHIDIDGTDPLQVVSGTIKKYSLFRVTNVAHFIGQVTSNTWVLGGRNLVIENLEFTWPGTNSIVGRIEIELRNIINPKAHVTFKSGILGGIWGPYEMERKSIYFRDVEIEIDREDDAETVEPFDTHTHPDRPADLPQEELTIAKAYKKAGINVTYSSNSNVISTAGSGGENGWTYQELHDAMEDHWSAFENKPQWKAWIFLAEHCSDPGTCGAMFDGFIDEPDGVDRQGTAVFTETDWIFTTGGIYSIANPPEAESVQRELFFTTVHEAGHMFNLFHPWQKELDTPWEPPSWADPMLDDPDASTWMNYPETTSPGYSASDFYISFYYRFTDAENLFLRHAPEKYVQMGAEEFGTNHGRAIARLIDPRIELSLRSRRDDMEFGQPVFMELRLRNVSEEPVLAHNLLEPRYGYVTFGITSPDGRKVPFVPPLHVDTRRDREMLEPGAAFYASIQLTAGRFGFHFKQPGAYRIEACYTNLDGTQASAVKQLWVRTPTDFNDFKVLAELYSARLARSLYFRGTRLMEDVNDKLDWVVSNLSPDHPANHYLRVCLALPSASPYKILRATSDSVEIVKPDPEEVRRRLEPVLTNLEEMSDSLGHIESRKVVDVFSKASIEAKDTASAVKVKKDLLALYKKRGVLQTVLDEIELELKKIK